MQSFCLLFQIDPRALIEGVWGRHPLRVVNSKVHHSLHIVQLSLFVPVYCTRKAVWCGLSKALICGYSNMSLGAILLLCSFIRIIVVDFPLSPWPLWFQVLGHSGIVRYWYHLLEWAFKSIEGWLFQWHWCHYYTSISFKPVTAVSHRLCSWVMIAFLLS